MTVQEICKIAESEKSCLLYFGDNIECFNAVSAEFFENGQIERFQRGIERDLKYHPHEPLELVLRTSGHGNFAGWNTLDSIEFYGIDFARKTVEYDDLFLVDCRRSKKAVIL